MGRQGCVYLSGQWQEGMPGAVAVPVKSLVVLFTLQHCQSKSARVVLVTERAERRSCIFPVNLDSLCFVVTVKRENECPMVLRHCELPLVVEEEKNYADEKEKEENKTKIIEHMKEKEEEWKMEEKENMEEDEEEQKNKDMKDKEDRKTVGEEKENEKKNKNRKGKNGWREGPWCSAGLCSSLRLAIKQVLQADPQQHCMGLLGFRQSCLQACAEVSVWTKFCEVESLGMLVEVVRESYSGTEEIIFPKDLIRYERHLRRPPILHNALKRTQQHIRDTVRDKDKREELCQKPLAQLPPLKHDFAEGLDMTLADVILFVSFHIVLSKLEKYVTVSDIVPLVVMWHELISSDKHIQAALPVLERTKELFHGTPNTSAAPRLVVPEVPDMSIYKSDPERNKAPRGAFTRQEDIECVLKVVEEAGVEPGYSPCPPPSSASPSGPILWSSFPAALTLEGNIPKSRLERKMQQVENICNAVLGLAQDGDVIVDFCAGGGHVGILLAHCLPRCQVLLVENKEASLLRARDRVRELKLENVSFIQSNLDYFRGDFDIGVSLHACGAATDLVLGKCVEQGAAFVVTPCCYGSTRPNHKVSYPRSNAFRTLSLTLEQYLTLGHAADQTHGEGNPKSEQGQRCMRLVDGDRLTGAKEAGYVTHLILMQPPTCSPKNHLLLGTLDK